MNLPIWEIVVVFVCLFLNAALSLVEMAFVSVGRAKVKALAEAGNRAARELLALRENPERTLSILQIGITLVGLSSAAVGGAGAEEFLSPYFENAFGISENFAETISVILLVLPLTYLSVVIGELVPKVFALRHSMRIALFSCRGLSLADRILSPLVSFLEWSTKKVLATFSHRVKAAAEPSPEETDIDISRLTDLHQEYILNMVNLETKRVQNILVPWSRVSFIRKQDSADDVVATVVSSQHTRLPVLDGEQVIGILYAKEFMALKTLGDADWYPLIRPVLRVYEDAGLLKLLRLMQQEKNHICLIYSREQRLLGIVTLKDILEEIVGDIMDEDEDGALKRILGASAKLKILSFEK